VLGVLNPLITERDEWALIVSTEDGSADVYGLGEATTGFIINPCVGSSDLGRHVPGGPCRGFGSHAGWLWNGQSVK